jgi:AraC family transcriptional regulator, positive regulator of tynA and feaB
MRTLTRRSTGEVPAEQRLRFWRDTLHEDVVEMDMRPEHHADFFSRIDFCPLAHISPHQAWGSPQKLRRNRVEIARGEKSAYYLVSQPSLAWRSDHAGQDVCVQPGESVLIDSRIPYAFSFPFGLNDLSVELPVSFVERWLPDPLQVIGRPLQAASDWGLALRGAKEALTPSHLVELALPDELVQDQLGALLALACATDATPKATDPVLRDRLLQAMRERLSKPGLAASEVALACGVSVRTLHRRFATEGRTFAGVLMQLRTDAAARMLVDRRFREISIAEIGRRCGFLDPSHFARQFQRSRKVAPHQFRALG